MLRRSVSLFFAALLIFVLSKASHAELATVGPANPQDGFPSFYQDTSGLALELCLEGDGLTGLCLFDPPRAEEPFSVEIGFREDAAYWLAQADIALPGATDARLELALSASFFGGDPADGNQITFGRIHISIDTPVAGDYTVVHPYGTEVFTNAPQGVRAIDFFRDIGDRTPNFAAALAADIGPFLVALIPIPPAGFVGDPQIDQTVTGSPTGNNLFRVTGPPGSNLDGAGGNTVETNLFSVAGKIFSGLTPTPLVIERTSFKRLPNAPNGVVVDVSATSSATATLIANVGSLKPIPPTMEQDGAGNFFVHVDVPGPGSLIVPPDQVLVTATAPGQTPTNIFSDLVDEITITMAAYDVFSDRMLIRASSSDKITSPILTAKDHNGNTLGTLAGGSLLLTGMTIPPPRITVESSAGGSAGRDVLIVNLSP